MLILRTATRRSSGTISLKLSRIEVSMLTRSSEAKGTLRRRITMELTSTRAVMMKLVSHYIILSTKLQLRKNTRAQRMR